MQHGLSYWTWEMVLKRSGLAGGPLGVSGLLAFKCQPGETSLNENTLVLVCLLSWTWIRECVYSDETGQREQEENELKR
jgi:hypothetical protein